MKLYRNMGYIDSNDKLNKIGRIILISVFSILFVMYSFWCPSGVMQLTNSSNKVLENEVNQLSEEVKNDSSDKGELKVHFIN